MNDLIAHMQTITTYRPTEADLTRVYKNRRATWIPVQGEKVTVWSTLHDPDRDIAFDGKFDSQDDDSYWVILHGDKYPGKFSKRSIGGAILWRLDTRERGQITETER